MMWVHIVPSTFHMNKIVHKCKNVISTLVARCVDTGTPFSPQFDSTVLRGNSIPADDADLISTLKQKSLHNEDNSGKCTISLIHK